MEQIFKYFVISKEMQTSSGNGFKSVSRNGKGLKQVADVQHKAGQHLYFTLMCNSKTVRIILTDTL